MSDNDSYSINQNATSRTHFSSQQKSRKHTEKKEKKMKTPNKNYKDYDEMFRKSQDVVGKILKNIFDKYAQKMQEETTKYSNEYAYGAEPCTDDHYSEYGPCMSQYEDDYGRNDPYMGEYDDVPMCEICEENMVWSSTMYEPCLSDPYYTPPAFDHEEVYYGNYPPPGPAPEEHKPKKKSRKKKKSKKPKKQALKPESRENQNVNRVDKSRDETSSREEDDIINAEDRNTHDEERDMQSDTNENRKREPGLTEPTLNNSKGKGEDQNKRGDAVEEQMPLGEVYQTSAETLKEKGWKVWSINNDLLKNSHQQVPDKTQDEDRKSASDVGVGKQKEPRLKHVEAKEDTVPQARAKNVEKVNGQNDKRRSKKEIRKQYAALKFTSLGPCSNERVCFGIGEPWINIRSISGKNIRQDFLEFFARLTASCRHIMYSVREEIVFITSPVLSESASQVLKANIAPWLVMLAGWTFAIVNLTSDTTTTILKYIASQIAKLMRLMMTIYLLFWTQMLRDNGVLPRETDIHQLLLTKILYEVTNKKVKKLRKKKVFIDITEIHITELGGASVQMDPDTNTDSSTDTGVDTNLDTDPDLNLSVATNPRNKSQTPAASMNSRHDIYHDTDRDSSDSTEWVTL